MQKIGGQQIGELQGAAGAHRVGEDRRPVGDGDIQVGRGQNPPGGVGGGMEAEFKAVVAGQQIGDNQDRWSRGNDDRKAVRGGQRRHNIVVRDFDGIGVGAGQCGRVGPSQHVLVAVGAD
jgi:hypothetical protein